MLTTMMGNGGDGDPGSRQFVEDVGRESLSCCYSEKTKPQVHIVIGTNNVLKG